MAGIGFALRKLASRDDFIGITRAFIHASVIATGPWMMTVLSLGMIYFFTEKVIAFEQGIFFRTIMIYNFSFSLVFSAPVYMVTTRFVSDKIFMKDVHTVPGVLIGALGAILCSCLPIALILYLVLSSMPAVLAIQAIINFLLLSFLWISMLFLSSLKNYKALTYSFFFGIVIATAATIILAFSHGAVGMLFGFNLGLVFIVFSIFGIILAEYPYRFREPGSYFFYFRSYADLACAGLLYNAGIWVDKWIMWFAPDAEITILGLPTFPIYDTAMFVAFLTIVPIMALFVFSMETNFFECYVDYFRNLRENAPYHILVEKQKAIMAKVLENARNFIVLQGCVSLLFIFLAPSLFQAIGMSYLELGIFRLGVLGVFFNTLVLFSMIFLSYFDSRENYLLIASILFISNLIFSWISRQLGFVFYGYGYFFAMFITFAISGLILLNYVKNLSYQIFITNNVRRLPIKEPK